MMHPIIMQELAKARQADRLREADQRRLGRLARVGHPGLADLLLKRIGVLLNGTGARPKRRHALERSGLLASAEK